MSIVSLENQTMLYDIMLDIIIDNNIILEDHVNIQEFLRDKCMYFHTKRFEFGSKEDVNKKIISLCYNFILSNQKKTKPKPKKKKKPMSLQEVPKPTMITQKELFDRSLKEQQENFENSININKPKEIDFEDKNEEGQIPIKNLDEIMNQTLADRQKELENITNYFSKNEKDKAKEWLNRKKENNMPPMKIDEVTPKITINEKEDINLNIKKVVNEKRVKFNIDENNHSLNVTSINDTLDDDNSLIENFKNETSLNNQKIISKSKETSNSLDFKLDMIISNQKIILDILKKNNLLDTPQEESHREVVEFDAI